MKQKKVSFFTIDELDAKLSDYIYSNSTALEEDVAHILRNAQEIELLFKNPEHYKDGNEFKARMRHLLDIYFHKTIAEKKTDLQEALIILFYRFYRNIDSPPLQEGIIFGLEKDGAKTVNQAKHDILMYSYMFNAAAFEANINEPRFIHRVNNQRRIIRFFLSNDAKSLEPLNLKISGDINDQIYKNTYLETLNDVPDDEPGFNRSRNILSEKQKHLLEISFRDAMTTRYFIQELYDMDIPEQIGYMYIKASVDRDYLYKRLLLHEKLAVEYKLYTLLRLAVMEANPFSVIYDIERLLSLIKKRSGKAYPETVVTEEIENTLRDGAEKMLPVKLHRKISTGDNYLDSLGAEMLFAAEAVIVHVKYPETDLIDFLKQLKFTFVTNKHTEYIVQYNGDCESEHVRIAMDNDKEYIDSIRDFVESIYRRNTGDGADGSSAKFKSVAKGHSALIKVMRKTLGIFILCAGELCALALQTFQNS